MSTTPLRPDYHYYAIYKPYGMLSQFTPDQPGQSTLRDLYEFPKTVYPVGRLDRDSEGLLLLTDDKAWHTALLHPDKKAPKTYLAQVEGRPEAAALSALQSPMTLRIRKKDVQLRPALVTAISKPDVSDRDPPIRYRASIPDSWLQLVITEGKNRQVRKMCAHVGHPVLRLIRSSIGIYALPDHRIGTVYRIDKEGYHQVN